ncbi:MAG: M28 family peptidase [Alistipes sp.]|nr:M28 family peptidase [Alistipes sp.]
MSRVRLVVLVAVAAVVGAVAFGLWSRPAVKGISDSGFSAERVVEDIAVISREHHSVAHPTERAEVRNYLVDRLEELGADTVRLYEYQALVGPKDKHVIYTFDATNVLAEFGPVGEDASTTSLMMVAHYDSRYSQPMPHKDTVWSYGAADDGYGVGVILETVAEALKYRNEWKQGIKVLFTDAEEVGMMGMTAQWENNREVFDNVGLMINLEARGPYGPALLFETSPGNERLMDLYAAVAEYPYTYSLTTVVYSFMPNFTDFTIVKDSIPGFNFSTIADINHYHTDLDNFSNINPQSIQHYGAQITPIVREYLTNVEYADVDSLRADSDTVNFTLPLLGLFNFSTSSYWVINVTIFVLFVLLLCFDALRGRVQIVRVLSSALGAFVAAIAALIVGELIAGVACLACDAQFKPFGIVQGVVGDNVIMVVSVVVVAVVALLGYMRGRRRVVSLTAGSIREGASAQAALLHANNKLYAALVLMFVLSLLLIVAIGENLMFFIPLFAATLALLLYRITRLRVWCLVAIALILLHGLSFLYALAMALTIGAFGAVLMLALLDMLVIIPLVELYVRQR